MATVRTRKALPAVTPRQGRTRGRSSLSTGTALGYPGVWGEGRQATIAEESEAMSAPDDAAPSKDGRFAVLDVFGLKLEVSNPRLAELLTMDAKEALTSDMRDLVGAEETPDAAQVREAVPDVVIAPSTPHTDELARARKEFRQRVETIAETLGFETRGDGKWTSETGIAVSTRTVERPLSLAAASHFVSEVAQRCEQAPDEESAVLFVVESQQTADVFKVAIRQRRMHHLMRTVSIDNLEDMRALKHRGLLSHAQIVVLLAPVADIDVGEMLSVLHANEDAAAGAQ